MRYARTHQSNHHQIFINSLDEVVIADQSGTTPDETDDGPLIVAPDAEVTVSFGLDWVTFRVPVLVARSGSDMSTVTMNFEDFRALHKQLPRLRITPTASFIKAHRLLQEAWVMAAKSEQGEAA